ncbi:septum formation inhibitor Maf [Flavobacterium sp. ASW18X]|uniref:septum formation inhibitor Maf n=1 Tax=Flavobacterium sp. ASW18X TaxID=2572595 RepID=UPI0010AEC34B|nr:septum formation inhibitor Maf [Flavobacterium sp. ASW18X]TKD66241.1 septum formation inhibitor Maf [Flavobacterium sp. ASW18X]
MKTVFIAFSTLLSVLLIGCKQSLKEQEDKEPLALASAEKVDTTLEKTKQPLSQEFKNYWYAGNAEITSYVLEQARYGELRKGSAVLIYVTEPFLPNKQVKADGNNADNIPVLKLNTTKNYLTGIYPYSIMASTFYPVYNNQHALKTSFSAQEWCGQVYAQLNNRDKFEVVSHSYFESEADQEMELPKTHLENEIWNIIRINPETLPVGTIEILPSLEYFRLKHKEVKALMADASLSKEEGVSTYTLSYQNKERELKIQFNTAFPHEIVGWEETFVSGYGTNANKITSKAKKLKQLKTPYWRQNSNKDVILRDSLGL